MNKKQFAFMTTLLFLGNNFVWLVWQHFLNEGLYDMPFFLIWIPVMILAMTAVFFFVFLRKREKKRSPFYFIWSFFLSTAEFGVLLFFHYVFDLFTGGRSPAVCFIIIMHFTLLRLMSWLRLSLQSLRPLQREGCGKESIIQKKLLRHVQKSPRLVLHVFCAFGERCCPF